MSHVSGDEVAASGEPLAIDGRGLTKHYGPTRAADGVDLAVRAGRVHGLLGPNGAGKSTVLGMLFGLVVPDGGRLRLLGREAGSPGALDGVAGFVEMPRFYPYLDARSNLAGLAALDRGPSAGVDEVLSMVGLEGSDGQKVRGFSLGMRQRLGLAAALLRRPRLLIVDEPANGLDPAGMRDLRSLLRRLGGDGMTVLLSSHDMVEVEGLCDDVTVLRSGRVVFDGTMAEVRAAATDPAYRMGTGDDAAALDAASGSPVDVRRHDDGGLAVVGAQDAVDAYVVALGRAGVAVRSLSMESTPLASLFFHLTEGPATGAVEERPVVAAVRGSTT